MTSEEVNAMPCQEGAKPRKLWFLHDRRVPRQEYWNAWMDDPVLTFGDKPGWETFTLDKATQLYKKDAHR